MSLSAILLLIGLLFIVFYGALSLMRREGLSSQFAFEAIAITLIFTGLAEFAHLSIHPVLFLAVLYLLTMRGRLLVDVGNSFARRGRLDLAERLYQFAFRLFPDHTVRLIIQINHGVLLLQQGNLDQAILDFKGILDNPHRGYLGVKYEAATHYNLGQAYRRKNMESQAIAEFNKVLDTWPTSEYAQRAQVILSQHRHKDKPSSDENVASDKR